MLGFKSSIDKYKVIFSSDGNGYFSVTQPTVSQVETCIFLWHNMIKDSTINVQCKSGVPWMKRLFTGVP